jgi:hypothetical protein
MSAGNYPIRFAWAVHSRPSSNTFGEKPDAYAAPVNIWGGYQGERQSGTITENGATTANTTATIALRNYLDVKPLDYLTDPQSGEEWEIQSVRRGDNETICEVSY